MGVLWRRQTDEWYSFINNATVCPPCFFFTWTPLRSLFSANSKEVMRLRGEGRGRKIYDVFSIYFNSSPSPSFQLFFPSAVPLSPCFYLMMLSSCVPIICRLAVSFRPMTILLFLWYFILYFLILFTHFFYDFQFCQMNRICRLIQYVYGLFEATT